MQHPLLGTTIGERYVLHDVVGQGGMGVVFRASDERLGGRPCAIKLLTGGSLDPVEATRFERELNIISRLRSQNVVGVLDSGSLSDGRQYIVMELLEGLPLSALLRQQKALGPERTVGLASGVLSALAEAREIGIVHRDLKPANVFVTVSRSGRELAKVLDFGIAKDTRRSNREADLTAASMLIGTPKYMAPEQFLKKPADHRTDLYAVGLLMYQCLAGAPPHTTHSEVPDTIATMPDEFKIGWLHINAVARELVLPDGLWQIIDKLLSKEPEDRFQTAEEAIDALRGYTQQQSRPLMTGTGGFEGPRTGEISQTTGFLGETVAPLGEARPPSKSGGKGLVVAAVVAVLALGGGAAFFLTRGGDGPADESAPVAAAKKAEPKAARSIVIGAEPTCSTELLTQPAGAEVLKGSRVLGITPYRVERPCTEQWMLQVRKTGFGTQNVHFRGRTPSSKQTVKLAPR